MGERSSRTGRSQIGDFFTKFYSDKSSEGSVAGGAIKPELSTLRGLSDGGSKGPRSDRRDRRERDAVGGGAGMTRATMESTQNAGTGAPSSSGKVGTEPYLGGGSRWLDCPQLGPGLHLMRSQR